MSESQSSAARKRPARKTASPRKAATKGPVAKQTASKKAAPSGPSIAKSTSKQGATRKATATKPATKKTAAEKAAPRNSKIKTDATAATFRTFFKQARDRAQRIIDDPDAIRAAAEKATKSSAGRSGPFAEIADDFRALIRLCVSYSRGHYRDIPTDQLVIVLGGLIYVVSPLDLIPDVLPGGFVDDAVVVGWVVKTVRSELDAFREWEVGNAPS